MPGYDARLVRSALLNSRFILTHISKYMLWTDDSSREFIASYYPWFLETFDEYEYNIQRADAIRYFVLYHFGGIYFDLDIGCNRPLDPLLIFPIILPKTIPVGVSNDLIFAEKGHSFLAQTIHNLAVFDHSWMLNYPTVMFSTGPMFLSAQYAVFTTSQANNESDPIRILPKSLYGKNAKDGEAPHSFFSHFYGSSWHADDAAFVAFLGVWGKGLMWVGLIVLLAGLLRMVLPRKKRRYNSLLRISGYEVLFPRWPYRASRTSLHSRLTASSDSSTAPPSPADSSPSSPLDSPYPIFQLPFNLSSLSSPTDPYIQQPSSPVVQAFHRLRNRFTKSTSREDIPSTPLRPKRSYSRGVLFFLPAIFTQSQDDQASQPESFSEIPLLSRPVPRGTLAPDKQQSADAETSGELGPNAFSAPEAHLIDFVDDQEPPSPHNSYLWNAGGSWTPFHHR